MWLEGPENTVRCELKNADNCIYVFYITEREIDGARIVEALADGLEGKTEDTLQHSVSVVSYAMLF